MLCQVLLIDENGITYHLVLLFISMTYGYFS